MPKRGGAVHVATTTRTYKGKVYRTHLLRRSYREGNQVKHETLGNLSHLPPDLIDLIRRRLAGEEPPEGDGFEILRSYPHGHVAAVLAVLREAGVVQLLASQRSRPRDLIVALIAARILMPASKLATMRGIREESAASSLGLELELERTALEDREIYEALDWLLARQPRIEGKLAKRHLHDGTLVLYDVSSSYYTGRKSDLVAYGHSRDSKKGFPQIVYGLLCNADGCPIAIEVFAGNTADPTTLASQIQKVRQRFGVQRVVIVGDRGMITSRRIEEEFRDVDGLDWITALRADNIKKLASQGVIERSLFDERDLAEISSPDFPGERLIVCRNPLLAAERTRKRNELLAATEKVLDQIVAATQRARQPLRGKDKIGLRVGKVKDKYKMAKHFVFEIREDGFRYRRDEERIAAEANLDGVYVVRTSVERDALASEDTVRAYKDLSKVERAFRCMKTVDLKVRPIYHWLDDRIRSHVFLCMLAYYVEWHMRQKLTPLLFEDHDKEAADAGRPSIVAPAERSEAAQQKDSTKRTADGYPVHSFRSLLQDLATLTKNRVRVPGTSDGDFYMLSRPTPLQQRAFELLNASP